MVTTTVITKETIDPNTAEAHTETIVTTTEIESETIEPEDEFDKIYEEIVVNTPTEVVFDDILLNPKVEDPEKLESKFEEIIHDYDEHKVEPIDVEVVTRSKLPLLKRKSQHNIELSAQADRVSKIIAARDRLRLSHNVSMDENFEDALDNELRITKVNNHPNVNENKETDSVEETSNIDTQTETETKHEIIFSPNFKTEITSQFTKSISSSSANEQENVASSSIIETTIVKEVSTNGSNEKKEHKQHHIIEDNILKHSIRIGIPALDSFIHEYSGTNETTKTTEVNKVLSYTSNSEELSGIDNVSELENEISVSETQNDTTTIETADSYFERQLSKNNDFKIEPIKSENVETLKSVDMIQRTEYIQEPVRVKGTKVDENVQLRGKIERIISKIDSREVIETERNQRESINELKKKKSVLSKIAMFEVSKASTTIFYIFD